MSKLVKIVQSISTIGSSFIGYAGSMEIAHDPIVQGAFTLGAGALGGSVVFLGIPSLLRNGLVKEAFALGLIMNATWALNAPYLINKAVYSECVTIDSLYPSYKQDEEEATVTKTKDYSNAIALKENALIAVNKEIVRLASKTSINSIEYKTLHKDVTAYLVGERAKNRKTWSKRYVPIAQAEKCSTNIRFNGLIECISHNRWDAKNNVSLLLLEEKSRNSKSLAKDIKDLKIKKLKDISKAKLANNTVKQNALKIKNIEKKANENLADTKTYIYLFMVGFGFFIEVASMMWNEIINRKVESKEEKKVNEKIDTVEVYSETLYDYAKSDFIIAMATRESFNINEFDSLELLNRLKHNGRHLSLNNAMIGAFLYAHTVLEDGKYLSSWNDLTVGKIILVNGRDSHGNKFDSYTDSRTGKVIKTLGSTARELQNKVITKPINPQQEAISLLQDLERGNKERFNPKNISVKDMISVMINFKNNWY